MHRLANSSCTSGTWCLYIMLCSFKEIPSWRTAMILMKNTMITNVWPIFQSSWQLALIGKYYVCISTLPHIIMVFPVTKWVYLQNRGFNLITPFVQLAVVHLVHLFEEPPQESSRGDMGGGVNVALGSLNVPCRFPWCYKAQGKTEKKTAWQFCWWPFWDG